jgi:hypothetical protein
MHSFATLAFRCAAMEYFQLASNQLSKEIFATQATQATTHSAAPRRHPMKNDALGHSLSIHAIRLFYALQILRQFRNSFMSYIHTLFPRQLLAMRNARTIALTIH